jgi:hypothetical protein
MSDRRYDDPRRFESRRQSEEEQRLRRGPHEDMRPGSREEWEQNREDSLRAQESLRTRGPGDSRDLREDPDRTGRSGREYARDEGPFYDELREARQRPYVPAEASRSTSRPYTTAPSLPLSPGRRPPRAPRHGYGERDTPELHERIRRDALLRDQREGHLYEPRYGLSYGHGPGVENMDPPIVGYGMSRSRADDHEMGHGGFIGGGYGRTGRRDMPERTGRGPKGYTRSDERIREDICEQLMDAWMNAEHVDIRVKDGEVTLVGSVRTRDEKHAIENLAADVLGVKDVHNSLRVLRGGVREEPDLRRPVEPPDDLLHS